MKTRYEYEVQFKELAQTGPEAGYVVVAKRVVVTATNRKTALKLALASAPEFFREISISCLTELPQYVRDLKIAKFKAQEANVQ